MLMQSTRSAAAWRAAAAAASTAVSGLNATPTPRPSSRARAATAGGVVRRLDVEGDAVAARLGELREVMAGVVDHQVAVEHAAGLVDRRRDRAEHDRPDRHRRDEVPVADVEVEDARAGTRAAPRSARRAAEVGRVQRRLDSTVSPS